MATAEPALAQVGDITFLIIPTDEGVQQQIIDKIQQSLQAFDQSSLGDTLNDTRHHLSGEVPIYVGAVEPTSGEFVPMSYEFQAAADGQLSSAEFHINVFNQQRGFYATDPADPNYTPDPFSDKNGTTIPTTLANDILGDFANFIQPNLKLKVNDYLDPPGQYTRNDGNSIDPETGFPYPNELFGNLDYFFGSEANKKLLQQATDNKSIAKENEYRPDVDLPKRIGGEGGAIIDNSSHQTNNSDAELERLKALALKKTPNAGGGASEANLPPGTSGGPSLPSGGTAPPKAGWTEGGGAGGGIGPHPDPRYPKNPKIPEINNKKGTGKEQITPLVLDLDGDGIELTSYTDLNTSFFDLDVIGFARRTAWVSSDDALLARDIDGDGLINNGSELFGPVSGTGFAELSDFDTDGDGHISQQDSAYNQILVWRDLNQNGVSDWNELKTLEETGITDIDLNYQDVNRTINGNTVTQTSTYTINGSVREIADVLFVNDTTDTRYAQAYTLDMLTLYLPNMRGYGLLPDAHIAMSLDNDVNDPDSLISLVKTFSEKTFSNLFTSDNTVLADIREIMFRWAGVDDVVIGSRGTYVDAQQLEFIEEMTGGEFYQQGLRHNPLIYAGQYLTQAFDIAQDHFYAMLMAQTAAKDLFEGDFYYNIYTDTFDGITGLNITVLNALEAEATALATTGEKTIFWANVIRMVEYSIGTAALDAGDLAALESALDDSGLTTLSVADIVDTLVSKYSLTVTNGTSGADVLTGAALNDQLNGLDGNDTLSGGTGNDELNGSDGDDTMTGGAGSDYLTDWTGNDTYIYASGDGNDVIAERTGTDKILFGTGIDAGDLTFTRLGNDLQIDINDGINQGQIYLAAQFVSGKGLETIDFNGGSTLDLTTLNHTFNGTSNGETLQGVAAGGGDDDIINANGGNDKVFGLAGNDTLHGNDGADTIDGGADGDVIYGDAGIDKLLGNSGDDTIYGGDGNDTIFAGAGANTMDGGAGNDSYYASKGNDRYEFSGGNDVIRETGGADAIYLAAGFTEANTRYFRIGNDLKIVLTATDSITIKNFHAGAGYRVENLHFNGGSTVALNSVLMFLQGDDNANTISGGSAADEIFGYASNDTLDGGSGNDNLYGGLGNDTLTGGVGTDTLDGGAGDDELADSSGDDTYVFTSGNDHIVDSSSSTTDIIKFIEGWESSDVKFERYATDLGDLVLTMNASNSITIEDQFIGGAAC